MTMNEAISAARVLGAERHVTGFDQAALDAAARQGFADGAFEESEEEGAAVIEEFYPENLEGSAQEMPAAKPAKVLLADKLSQKAAQLNGNGASASSTVAARASDRDGRP